MSSHLVDGPPRFENVSNKTAESEDVLASNQRLMKRVWGGSLQTEPLETDTCLYTDANDHDYIISAVPNLEGVIIGGGGSGHGFKMGPAIGDALACLALGLEPSFNVAKFSVERATLRKPHI